MKYSFFKPVLISSFLLLSLGVQAQTIVKTLPKAVLSVKVEAGHYNGFRSVVKLKITVESDSPDGEVPFVLTENAWNGDNNAKTLAGGLAGLGTDVTVSQKIPGGGPSVLFEDTIPYTWTTLGIGSVKENTTRQLRFFKRNVLGRVEYIVLKQRLDFTGKITVSDQNGNTLLTF